MRPQWEHIYDQAEPSSQVPMLGNAGMDGGVLKPLRLVEADTNPDLTSAFGGTADMGGPTAGLVTGRK